MAEEGLNPQVSTQLSVNDQLSTTLQEVSEHFTRLNAQSNSLSEVLGALPPIVREVANAFTVATRDATTLTQSINQLPEHGRSAANQLMTEFNAAFTDIRTKGTTSLAGLFDDFTRSIETIRTSSSGVGANLGQTNRHLDGLITNAERTSTAFVRLASAVTQVDDLLARMPATIARSTVGIEALNNAILSVGRAAALPESRFDAWATGIQRTDAMAGTLSLTIGRIAAESNAVSNIWTTIIEKMATASNAASGRRAAGATQTNAQGGPFNQSVLPNLNTRFTYNPNAAQPGQTAHPAAVPDFSHLVNGITNAIAALNRQFAQNATAHSAALARMANAHQAALAQSGNQIHAAIARLLAGVAPRPAGGGGTNSTLTQILSVLQSINIKTSSSTQNNQILQLLRTINSSHTNNTLNGRVSVHATNVSINGQPVNVYVRGGGGGGARPPAAPKATPPGPMMGLAGFSGPGMASQVEFSELRLAMEASKNLAVILNDARLKPGDPGYQQLAESLTRSIERTSAGTIEGIGEVTKMARNIIPYLNMDFKDQGQLADFQNILMPKIAHSATALKMADVGHIGDPASVTASIAEMAKAEGGVDIAKIREAVDSIQAASMLGRVDPNVLKTQWRHSNQALGQLGMNTDQKFYWLGRELQGGEAGQTGFDLNSLANRLLHPHETHRNDFSRSIEYLTKHTLTGSRTRERDIGDLQNASKIDPSEVLHRYNIVEGQGTNTHLRQAIQDNPQGAIGGFMDAMHQAYMQASAIADTTKREAAQQRVRADLYAVTGGPGGRITSTVLADNPTYQAEKRETQESYDFHRQMGSEGLLSALNANAANQLSIAFTALENVGVRLARGGLEPIGAVATNVLLPALRLVSGALDVFPHLSTVVGGAAAAITAIEFGGFAASLIASSRVAGLVTGAFSLLTAATARATLMQSLQAGGSSLLAAAFNPVTLAVVAFGSAMFAAIEWVKSLQRSHSLDALEDWINAKLYGEQFARERRASINQEMERDPGSNWREDLHRIGELATGRAEQTANPDKVRPQSGPASHINNAPPAPAAAPAPSTPAPAAAPQGDNRAVYQALPRLGALNTGTMSDIGPAIQVGPLPQLPAAPEAVPGGTAAFLQHRMGLDQQGAAQAPASVPARFRGVQVAEANTGTASDATPSAAGSQPTTTRFERATVGGREVSPEEYRAAEQARQSRMDSALSRAGMGGSGITLPSTADLPPDRQPGNISNAQATPAPASIPTTPVAPTVAQPAPQTPAAIPTRPAAPTQAAVPTTAPAAVQQPERTPDGRLVHHLPRTPVPAVPAWIQRQQARQAAQAAAAPRTFTNDPNAPTMGPAGADTQSQPVYTTPQQSWGQWLGNMFTRRSYQDQHAEAAPQIVPTPEVHPIDPTDHGILGWIGDRFRGRTGQARVDAERRQEFQRQGQQQVNEMRGAAGAPPPPAATGAETAPTTPASTPEASGPAGAMYAQAWYNDPRYRGAGGLPPLIQNMLRNPKPDDNMTLAQAQADINRDWNEGTRQFGASEAPPRNAHIDRPMPGAQTPGSGDAQYGHHNMAARTGFGAPWAVGGPGGVGMPPRPAATPALPKPVAPVATNRSIPSTQAARPAAAGQPVPPGTPNLPQPVAPEAANQPIPASIPQRPTEPEITETEVNGVKRRETHHPDGRTIITESRPDPKYIVPTHPDVPGGAGPGHRSGPIDLSKPVEDLTVDQRNQLRATGFLSKPDAPPGYLPPVGTTANPRITTYDYDTRTGVPASRPAPTPVPVPTANPNAVPASVPKSVDDFDSGETLLEREERRAMLAGLGGIPGMEAGAAGAGGPRAGGAPAGAGAAAPGATGVLPGPRASGPGNPRVAARPASVPSAQSAAAGTAAAAPGIPAGPRASGPGNPRLPATARPAAVPNAQAIAATAAPGAAAAAVGAIESRMGQSGAQVTPFLNEHGSRIQASVTAWCAAMVNGALQSQGIRGTGSLAAASFRNWGDKIDTAHGGKVQRGDVMYKPPGMDGITGTGHVGMFTGRSRVNPAGQTQYEVAQGNYGHRVASSWESMRPGLEVHRAHLEGQQVQQAAAAGAAGAPAALPAGGGAPSANARQAVESYLGRPVTNPEYTSLVNATHAESSGGRGNAQEQAMIMGSILNRARSNPGGISAVLNAPNQFQSVTGTAVNNHAPSAGYVNGPGPERRAGIETAAQTFLANVSHQQTNFTAAASGAYGPGTNIGYRNNMLAGGGAVVGGSVFNTPAPTAVQAGPAQAGPVQTAIPNAEALGAGSFLAGRYAGATPPAAAQPASSPAPAAAATPAAVPPPTARTAPPAATPSAARTAPHVAMPAASAQGQYLTPIRPQDASRPPAGGTPSYTNQELHGLFATGAGGIPAAPAARTLPSAATRPTTPPVVRTAPPAATPIAARTPPAATPPAARTTPVATPAAPAQGQYLTPIRPQDASPQPAGGIRSYTNQELHSLFGTGAGGTAMPPTATTPPVAAIPPQPAARTAPPTATPPAARTPPAATPPAARTAPAPSATPAAAAPAQGQYLTPIRPQDASPPPAGKAIPEFTKEELHRLFGPGVGAMPKPDQVNHPEKVPAPNAMRDPDSNAFAKYGHAAPSSSLSVQSSHNIDLNLDGDILASHVVKNVYNKTNQAPRGPVGFDPSMTPMQPGPVVHSPQ